MVTLRRHREHHEMMAAPRADERRRGMVAHTIRARANVLSTTTPPVLVAAGHPFRWLRFDNASAARYLALATLDAPMGSNPPDVLSVPEGAWVYVGGRAVFVSLLDPAGGFVADADENTEVVFHLFGGEQPPPVPYRTSTLRRLRTPTVLAVAPTLSTQGTPIIGARFLTVRFYDGTSRIGATSSHSVWFFEPGQSLWAHHPNDDFDVDGRGEVDATHDVETYALTGGYSRVAIVRDAGVAVNCDLIFSTEP